MFKIDILITYLIDHVFFNFCCSQNWEATNASAAEAPIMRVFAPEIEKYNLVSPATAPSVQVPHLYSAAVVSSAAGTSYAAAHSASFSGVSNLVLSDSASVLALSFALSNGVAAVVHSASVNIPPV